MSAIVQPPLSGLEPLRFVMRRLHLVRDERRELSRAIILVVLVLWVPLVLLSLGGWLQHHRFEAVAVSSAVHTRLLVALPLFLVAGQVLQKRTELVFERLANGGFLTDTAPLGRISRRAADWSRAWQVEAVLVAFTLAAAREVTRGGLAGSGLVPGTFDAPGSGPAAKWYELVAFPFFLFLASRIVWRWLVWSAALWQLSRLPLATEPTHPDRAGGLAFLARPTDALSMLVLAMSAISASSWAPRIAEHQAKPAAFGLTFVTFLLVAYALAIVPMLPLAPRLLRAFKEGLWEFDRLALTYGRRFRERWLVQPPGPELLGSPDIQSLADVGNSYREIVEMRFLPFGRFQALQLLIAAALPVVPLVLTQVSLEELLRTVAKALIG